MIRMNEQLFCFGALVLVLMAAVWFGPPKEEARMSPIHPAIQIIAERDGYVEGVAVSTDGTIYLTFRGESDIFRLQENKGSLEAVRSLLLPKALAVDGKGQLHAAYSVTGSRDYLNSVVGLVSNSPTIEEFRVGSRIGGIALDHAGSLYVSSPLSGEVWKVEPGGSKSLLSDPHATDQIPKMMEPEGIAVNYKGQVLLADGDNTVYLYEHGRLRQLAGKSGECDMRDGEGAHARFCGPTAVTADKHGDFLVVDQSCALRKVTVSGKVTTLIGSPFVGLSGLFQLSPKQCSSFVRAVTVAGNGDILLAARSALRIHIAY